MLVNKNHAFELFETLIAAAQKELLRYTLTSQFSSDQKPDKSYVTGCDRAIDSLLSDIAGKVGLLVVSEEGRHSQEIVQGGNYITIDPIDGTLGYIDYVQDALRQGDMMKFLYRDLGPGSDFCLLLGIVENGKPIFGACFNFVTREKILIDGSIPQNLIREKIGRKYEHKYAVYLDQRAQDDPLTKKILALPNIFPIRQAALGLKSLYTILNPHHEAITLHMVQSAGLWDILPAAVAARAFGGALYDGNGVPVKFKEYITLPGHGAIIIKGDKFKFILNELRK